MVDFRSPVKTGISTMHQLRMLRNDKQPLRGYLSVWVETIARPWNQEYSWIFWYTPFRK